jgi:hypothetical protein
VSYLLHDVIGELLHAFRGPAHTHELQHHNHMLTPTTPRRILVQEVMTRADCLLTASVV